MQHGVDKEAEFFLESGICGQAAGEEFVCFAYKGRKAGFILESGICGQAAGEEFALRIKEVRLV